MVSSDLSLVGFTLAVITGTVLAIAFSLRNFFILERRIAQIEIHIQKIAKRILKEEFVIDKQIRSRKIQRKNH